MKRRKFLQGVAAAICLYGNTRSLGNDLNIQKPKSIDLVEHTRAKVAEWYGKEMAPVLMIDDLK